MEKIPSINNNINELSNVKNNKSQANSLRTMNSSRVLTTFRSIGN